jgi:hypothetical protein
MTGNSRSEQNKEEKRTERAMKFWEIFSFQTRDGKPKSGFLIYTFCLSLALFGMYFGLFELVIDHLTPAMKSWPPVLINAVQSLLVSAAGMVVAAVLHRLFSEKRMMLAAYLWLLLYAIVTLVAMLFFLHGDPGTVSFLIVLFWFAGLPLLVALPVLTYLCKRDYQRPREERQEEGWRRFINTEK